MEVQIELSIGHPSVVSSTKGTLHSHMENKSGHRHESGRATKGYLLFDEETLNFFLYGNRKVRVIDVNKLKRNAENHQEPSTSKKQKLTPGKEEPPLTNAIRSFPDEVQLCLSSLPGAIYGVCAKEHIPLGTWIGPYEGRRIPPQHNTLDIDSSYLWEIFKDGKLSHFLDGSDEENSSWMRFIRCARHPKEQNLYAFQYCGNIFYRAFKEIPPGRELLVWYDDKYPQFLGIPLGMQDYEFYRESVTSLNPRGSPKISSSSTQVNSSNQDPKQYGARDSRNNPHTGGFRAPLTHAVKPRFTRPIGSMGSSFGREHFSSTPIRGGSGFTGPFREGNKGTEMLLIPPSANDKHLIRTSTSGSSLFSNKNMYQMQTRKSDLIPTTDQLSGESLKSSSTQGQSSNKQHLKPQDGMTEMRDSFAPNGTALSQRAMFASEVSRPPFTKNDQQVSPRTSEGPAFKQEHNLERTMPTLHPYLPKTPPLQRINHFNAERIDASGIPSEEFGMWRCRQCLKTFTQRVSLQMHECSKAPEKPYQCGQCTLSFATPSALRSHVDLHTNDKLYKCGFCSRAFSGATTLNNHIRTHTGEKPFNCDKCNKTFSQASHLARHQRVPGECLKTDYTNRDVKCSNDS